MNLSQVIQTVSAQLGQTEEFVATGAADTTHIANTVWGSLDDPPETEKFKNHYVVVKWDAGGAGAAPEGEWSQISDYTPTTQILTLSTALSIKVAAGDKILFVNNSVFPFLDYISACNLALQKIGTLSYAETSLTTVENQTEYSLPTGVIKVLDVQMETNDDTDDYRWVQVPDWHVYPTTTTLTTRPILYIPQQISGQTLKIIYDGYHAEVNLFSDKIHEKIPPTLLYSLTKYYVLSAYVNRSAGSVDKHWMNERMLAAQEAGVERSPERFYKIHRGMRWSDSDIDPLTGAIVP